MKRQIILLLLLFSTSSVTLSSSSEWSDSLKQTWEKSKKYSQEGWDKSKKYSQEGWDKSKQYGQYSWDETKKIWSSAEKMLSDEDSDEQRKQIRSDKEDERFREIWGATFSSLEEGLEKVDKINKAPESVFFGDDKKSLKKELDKILEKTIVLLEDTSINDYREKIADYNQQILTAKNNILKYREQRITAPRSHSIKKTKDKYDTDIEDEKKNIAEFETDIENIKINFRERLNDIGVNLTQSQTNILLSRIDADDIIQMSVVFDVLKKITAQLMVLMENSGEEIKQAKKYYGMHVVLLELVNYMQQKYINKVDAVYLPKIKQIIDQTLVINKESSRQIERESDDKRIAIYKKNVIAQELTLKTARLYMKNLIDQQNKVSLAQQLAQKDLALAQNTYQTVEVSANLLTIIKTSKDSFDALISLQIPEIIPFENLKMQTKYEELSELIKD